VEPGGLSGGESLWGSRPTRLVVGYDSHPASHRAVLAAAELAPALNASLVLVHVVGPADYPADPELRDWEARSAAEREALAGRARWLLSDAAVQWEYRTARGAPARVIAQRAHDLDALLIVVGAGSGRITSRMLHSSVPAELVRIQRRPVLVIPAPR
jgi:nucleotide-binding universal stress UspA family protein